MNVNKLNGVSSFSFGMLDLGINVGRSGWRLMNTLGRRWDDKMEELEALGE